MADDPPAIDAPPEGSDFAAHEAAIKRLVAALGARRPVSEIRALVEGRLRDDPGFLTRPDRDRGWIPLHHAVWKMSEVDVLTYFVEACPKSIRVKTRIGQELAIHIELQTLVPNFKAIQVLVRAWAASLYEPSYNGSLPLHLAVLPDGGHDRYFPLRFEIVRFLVEEGPRAIRLKGPQGRLPIHCLALCKTRVEPRTVDLLVDQYRESLMVRDDSGALPVHLVGSKASMEDDWMWMESPMEDDWIATESPRIVRHLVAKCPRSVRESTPHDGGGSLLHMALSSWPWADINDIRYLVSKCPDTLQVPDSEGNLPVHLAVASGEMEIVQFLVGRSPDSLRARGHKGRLPAHVAAVSDRMVEYFVNLWPDSIRERDEDGCTLLHLVASNAIGASSAAPYLVDRSPWLLGVADNEGRLALHAAVRYREPSRGSQELVRLLVERRPESIRQPDSRGNLPLHAAAVSYAPVPVLQYLVEQHPEALQARNGAGLLPVHLATHRERSHSMAHDLEYYSRFRSTCLELEVGTFRYLVEQWPECVRERDPAGRTLVHSALDGPASPGHHVAWFLLQEWPEAALVRDEKGLLPLHTAAAVDAPLDLLYDVLQLQQRLLREKKKSQKTSPSGPSTPKRSRTGESGDDDQSAPL